MLLSFLAAARLIIITPNLDFPVNGVANTTSLGVLEPGFAFDQTIVSWNIDRPANAAIKIEARAIYTDHTSKWFVLADWAQDTKRHPRASLKGQRDDDGTVSTDTLELKKPALKLELQVTLKNLGGTELPKLRRIAASFIDSKAIAEPDKPEKSAAWGKLIEVPQRAQGNYPNGGVLCSATSVSMILSHYAKQLNQPTLDHDVPEVEANVWDSVYNGAGNWPFNTAYAGSMPGMVGYVSRFHAISDLESWITAGFPVACSVSFDMLRGRPLSPEESGHLVVLIGFTEDGDPIFNDPAYKEGVRRIYKRSDFEKAWLYSKRTVYLIYPEGAKIPESANGLW